MLASAGRGGGATEQEAAYQTGAVREANDVKNGGGRDADVRALFHITEVAGKTPNEVEQLLGKPTELTPITNYPEDMPGEYRDYNVARLRVTIQFYRGIAIGAAIDIENPPAKDSTEALALVGLSKADLRQTFETPDSSRITMHIVRWRGTVDGIKIEDVSATREGPSAPVARNDSTVAAAKLGNASTASLCSPKAV